MRRAYPDPGPLLQRRARRAELARDDPGLMILVTGAAGKTGRAVIHALAARALPVRALVRRPEQIPDVRALGAVEAVSGDMRDRSVLDRVALGVHDIYHICPNVHPDEVPIGRAAIGAAVAGGVRRFVFHSVLHPQAETMPHHWKKLRVEELLVESGLDYTILQPASYMQNVLAQWRTIVENRVYAVPYPVDTRLGMVDLQDVAAAAAVVLAEPGHAGATYELAGPEVLTQIEIAEILSQRLERPVRAQQMPLEVWNSRARAAGLGEYQVDTMVRMFRYYGRYGFWGNPRVLEMLLGRSPTTFEAFVARSAAAR